MIRDEFPSPPELIELDEQIAELSKRVASKRLMTRVVVATLAIIAIGEGALITLAVAFGGGWTPGAAVGGLSLFGLAMAGAGAVGSYDDGGETERSLNRLRLDRREYLAKKRRREGFLSYARYRESVPDMIDRYRTRARTYRRLYYVLQVTVVVGSLTASTVTGALGVLVYARLAAVFLTLAVGIAASCSSLFRMRERCESLQAVADEMETQYRASQLQIGEYGSNRSENDVLRVLVERVEDLRSAQALKERILEQAPDSQRSSMS